MTKTSRQKKKWDMAHQMDVAIQRAIVRSREAGMEVEEVEISVEAYHAIRALYGEAWDMEDGTIMRVPLQLNDDLVGPQFGILTDSPEASLVSDEDVAEAFALGEGVTKIPAMAAIA